MSTDIFSPQRGSDGPWLKDISVNGCMCHRPKLHVLCTNCGWVCRGRIRYPCPQHPNVVFMYDYGGCPKCKLSENKLAEF